MPKKPPTPEAIVAAWHRINDLVQELIAERFPADIKPTAQQLAALQREALNAIGLPALGEAALADLNRFWTTGKGPSVHSDADLA